MKIGLILFIGGVNYAILTTALALNELLDDFVDDQLYLGFRNYFNTTHKDCVWRNAFKDRKLCAEDVKIWLYSNGSEELIDPTNSKWLHGSNNWDESKESIIFFHGYAAGDKAPPTIFMRDTFIKNGQYNYFMLDYGPVSRAPCYVSLVQNIKYKFEETMKKFGGVILGLDPALPLISNSDRLSWRDAKTVQTIQTNAGYYGDIGSVGHMDICVNNGNMQPFCVNSPNPHLCSHMYALCFMAESLFDKKKQLQAKRCTEVCPHLSVFQLAKTFNAPDHSNIHSNSIDNDVPENIVFGMNISHSARGSYCLLNMERPFCSMNKEKIGSKSCCSLPEMFNFQ